MKDQVWIRKLVTRLAKFGPKQAEKNGVRLEAARDTRKSLSMPNRDAEQDREDFLAGRLRKKRANS